MSAGPRAFTQEAINAVVELLAAAEEQGVPVLFTPDADGWRVSYASSWPAAVDDEIGYREIAVAHDLEVAANAALRPLLEHGQAYDRYLDRREAVEQQRVERQET